MHRLPFALPALAAPLLLALGCATTLEDLPSEGALDIRLDANTKVYGPHVPLRIKFWVDITNQSGGPVSPEKLRVELRVHPAGDRETVALKQSWTYSTASDRGISGTGRVVIAPGKRLTLPIEPERRDPNATADDIPLKLLPQGEYDLVAVLNGRHTSKPCRIRIERPDLKLLGRPR